MFKHPWEPLGKALLDYYNGDSLASLNVISDFEPPVMMSAELFFRGPELFSSLEQIAMRLCKGRILDIGAGAGSHVLSLQEFGYPVTAIDICTGIVKVMRLRGVKDARYADIFKFRMDGFPLGSKFDTLLMLMNGIGIVGNLSRLGQFFTHAKTLLNPNGERQLIMDSLDMRRSVTDAEKNARMLDKSRDYFGEVKYHLEYKGEMGPEYSWLYVDPDKLLEIAGRSGWVSDGIWQEEDGHYLTKLVLEKII